LGNIATDGQLMTHSWRFNAKNEMNADVGKATDENISAHVGAKEDLLTLGKRVAVDSVTLALPKSGPTGNSGAIVPAGNTAVMVEQFEGLEDDLGKNDVAGTP
jgi:hypothetical protein